MERSRSLKYQKSISKVFLRQFLNTGCRVKVCVCLLAHVRTTFPYLLSLLISHPYFAFLTDPLTQPAPTHSLLIHMSHPAVPSHVNDPAAGRKCTSNKDLQFDLFHLSQYLTCHKMSQIGSNSSFCTVIIIHFITLSRLAVYFNSVFWLYVYLISTILRYFYFVFHFLYMHSSLLENIYLLT